MKRVKHTYQLVVALGRSHVKRCGASSRMGVVQIATGTNPLVAVTHHYRKLALSALFHIHIF